MLSDIFPTGYHGATCAGVTTGSTVYVAGAGPVGLAAAYSAQLLGAAVVIVGDLQEERLAQARSFGCETIDVSEDTPIEEQIAGVLGIPEVDCAVDAVGFEATGHGQGADEAPATVLNEIQTDHPRWRAARHPGPVRHRRPRRRRPGRPAGDAQDQLRTRLGQEPLLLHGPVPGQEVQPRPDDEHPARQGPHRRRRQRHGRSASTRPPKATRTSTRARPRSTSSTRTATSTPSAKEDGPKGGRKFPVPLHLRSAVRRYNSP